MIERVFYKGKGVEQETVVGEEHMSDAVKALSRLFQESNLHREQEGEGKELWLVFDVDGVLVGDDIDATNLDDYLQQNDATVERFRQNIQRSARSGIHIALCTGRGSAFAHLLAEKLFTDTPPECIIAESGLLIERNGKRSFPSTIEPENARTFLERKQEIQDHFVAQGWGYWPQEHSISLRWPSTLTRDAGVEQIRTYLRSVDLLETSEITLGVTAINIAPRGASKPSALNDVVTSKGEVIYFGDSPGDHLAMREAAIVFTPANAEDRTQRYAAELTGEEQARTMFTLHLRNELLAGVADGLELMNRTIDFLKTQEHPKE